MLEVLENFRLDVDQYKVPALRHNRLQERGERLQPARYPGETGQIKDEADEPVLDGTSDSFSEDLGWIKVYEAR